jgi:hypothetical protein
MNEPNIKLIKEILLSMLLIIGMIVVMLRLNSETTVGVILITFFLFWCLNHIWKIFINFKLIKLNNKLVDLEKKKRETKQKWSSKKNKYSYTSTNSKSSFNSTVNDTEFYKKLFKNYLNSQQYKQQEQQEQQKYRNNYDKSKKLSNAYKLFKLSSASPLDEFKKEYRQLAIKWHPDKWTTSSDENKSIAERNFKKMQAAYELIKKDKNVK